MCVRERERERGWGQADREAKKLKLGLLDNLRPINRRRERETEREREREGERDPVNPRSLTVFPTPPLPNYPTPMANQAARTGCGYTHTRTHTHTPTPADWHGSSSDQLSFAPATQATTLLCQRFHLRCLDRAI